MQRCGVHASVDAATAPLVQFWTEYGFSESVFSDEDRRRFEGFDEARDTPDVVIAGPDWLLAIEAKMYHRPTLPALQKQLERQQVIVQFWQSSLGLPADRVRHVALLPQQYIESVRSIDAIPVDAVISWEEVVSDYREVSPGYWLDVLEEALDRYELLKSRSDDLKFGANAELRLKGEEIVARFDAGELIGAYMGRQGGLAGSALLSDVTEGTWRTQPYEVRRDAIAAQNWFPIEEFVKRVHGIE